MRQQFTVTQLKQNRGFFSIHKYMMLPAEIGTLYEQFYREYSMMKGEFIRDNVVSIGQEYVLELRGFVDELKEAVEEANRR